MCASVNYRGINTAEIPGWSLHWHWYSSRGLKRGYVKELRLHFIGWRMEAVDWCLRLTLQGTKLPLLSFPGNNPAAVGQLFPLEQ